ncbi:MAG: FAD:protein FMN transferase [Lachnospiraceae bacterium]|nr:FAD:protein FMN transferase [Lachnospiraceae bacterium]
MNIKKRSFWGLLCLCTLTLTVSMLTNGCSLSSDKNATASKTGFCLDTVVSLTLYGTKEEAPLEECFSLLETYESLLSRIKEGSDVWNINHSSGMPVTVSKETAQLIETALDYSARSDGAFDITIAPLLDLWNFKPEQHEGTVPDADQIQEALSHVDYKKVQLDGATVTLLDPQASIDLGGIAKGYIADRLRDYLISEGYDSALINLGGNILTVGAKPDGSAFRVGIRKPFSESGEQLETVACKDRSVVTSGTYERYFEQDGKRYHHILSPSDGYPVENGLASVTILSPSSTDADALSTACFVLGPEKGLELIESLDGIEALFVTDELEEISSSGFQAYTIS